VAEKSTLISLPEDLVDDFRAIYEKAVKNQVTEAVLAYAENGETYTKAEMKEMLFPNGSDKTYVETMANDAAYNYILVHLLVKKLGLEYTDKQYEKDVATIASDYTAAYGEEYTARDIEKLMGEEIIRLSFMDVLVSSELVKNVVGGPEFTEVKD
jgi:hypothetical protein